MFHLIQLKGKHKLCNNYACTRAVCNMWLLRMIHKNEKNSCIKSWYIPLRLHHYTDKASCLTIFPTWDSSPHFLVNWSEDGTNYQKCFLCSGCSWVTPRPVFFQGDRFHTLIDCSCMCTNENALMKFRFSKCGRYVDGYISTSVLNHWENVIDSISQTQLCGLGLKF